MLTVAGQGRFAPPWGWKIPPMARLRRLGSLSGGAAGVVSGYWRSVFRSIPVELWCL